MGKVTILGGGISGLSLAHFLKQSQPSLEIHVYEASQNLGGWCQTRKWSDIVSVPGLETQIFELGPRTFRSQTPESFCTLKLLGEMGLKDEVQMHSPAQIGKRYLFYGGSVKAMSLGSPKFMADSSMALAKFLSNDLIKVFGVKENQGLDQSISQFMLERKSDFILNVLMGSMLHGIYAGSPDYLSLREVFPSLYRAKCSSGSVSVGLLLSSFSRDKGKKSSNFVGYEPWMKNNSIASCLTLKYGVGSLVGKLSESLVKNGVKIHTSKRVTKVFQPSSDRTVVQLNGNEVISTDRVISTLPAYSAANILPPEQHVIRNLLESIKYNSIGLVSLLYKFEPGTFSVPIHGFGVLAAKGTALERLSAPLLGIIIDSRLWPNDESEKTGYVCLTVLMGGHYWSKASIETVKENDLQKYDMNQSCKFQDQSSSIFEARPIRNIDKIISDSRQIRDIYGSISSDSYQRSSKESSLPITESLLHHAIAYAERMCKCSKNSLIASHISFLPNAIPQYGVGHGDRLQVIDQLVRESIPTLDLSLGNFRSNVGVGVNHCISAAISYAHNNKISCLESENRTRQPIQ